MDEELAAEGPDEFGEVEDDEAIHADEEASGDFEADEALDDGDDSPRIGFRNIPTWNDAIGVMIARIWNRELETPEARAVTAGRADAAAADVAEDANAAPTDGEMYPAHAVCRCPTAHGVCRIQYMSAAPTATAASDRLEHLVGRIDALPDFVEVVESLQAGHAATLDGVWGSSCALIAAASFKPHRLCW